jgi:hypothetical protein
MFCSGARGGVEPYSLSFSLFSLATCPAHSRAVLENLGAVQPIVRLLDAENSTDVMRMYACWALSNLTADGPSPAIQEVREIALHNTLSLSCLN